MTDSESKEDQLKDGPAKHRVPTGEKVWCNGCQALMPDSHTHDDRLNPVIPPKRPKGTDSDPGQKR